MAELGEREVPRHKTMLKPTEVLNLPATKVLFIAPTIGMPEVDQNPIGREVKNACVE